MYLATTQISASREIISLWSVIWYFSQ